MTPDDIATVDARLEELRIMRIHIDEKIKQLEEAKALQAKPAAPPAPAAIPSSKSVDQKLCELKWTLAKSGSCEYNRAVPAPLLEEARKAADSKHEIQGSKYHFVIKDDGAILRFKRKGA